MSAPASYALEILQALFGHKPQFARSKSIDRDPNSGFFVITFGVHQAFLFVQGAIDKIAFIELNDFVTRIAVEGKQIFDRCQMANIRQVYSEFFIKLAL